jgi:hypothetical protein
MPASRARPTAASRSVPAGTLVWSTNTSNIAVGSFGHGRSSHVDATRDGAVFDARKTSLTGFRR